MIVSEGKGVSGETERGTSGGTMRKLRSVSPDRIETDPDGRMGRNGLGV